MRCRRTRQYSKNFSCLCWYHFWTYFCQECFVLSLVLKITLTEPRQSRSRSQGKYVGLSLNSEVGDQKVMVLPTKSLIWVWVHPPPHHWNLNTMHFGRWFYTVHKRSQNVLSKAQKLVLFKTVPDQSRIIECFVSILVFWTTVEEMKRKNYFIVYLLKFCLYKFCPDKSRRPLANRQVAKPCPRHLLYNCLIYTCVLYRTVILKLCTLAGIFVSLYSDINCASDDGSSNCRIVSCKIRLSFL